MKKFTTAMLTLAMVLSLTACGGSTQSTPFDNSLSANEQENSVATSAIIT